VTNTYTIDQGQPAGLGILTAQSESGAGSAAWSVPAGGGLDAFSRVTGEQDSLIRRQAYGSAVGAGAVSAALDGRPLSVQFDGPLGTGDWRADMDVAPGPHTLQVSAVDPSGLYAGGATSSFASATNAGDSITDIYNVDGTVSQRYWTNSLGQMTRSQSLAWDYFGRLIFVTDLDAQYNGYNWSALYDGLGRRVRTIYNMVVSNTPVQELSVGNELSEIDSWYDPQIEFLEVGVAVNTDFSMKTYGPDANGVYGGMQGVGGLDAITLEGHSSSTGVVQDYFGNVLGSISGSAVSWNATRLSGYGPVLGYQSPALGTDENVHAECGLVSTGLVERPDWAKCSVGGGNVWDGLPDSVPHGCRGRLLELILLRAELKPGAKPGLAGFSTRCSINS